MSFDSLCGAARPLPLMMRTLAFVIFLSLAACGPAPIDQGPGATLGANPARLTAAQPTTVLKLVTWDEQGEPGTGTAHFDALGGALLEGSEVALTNGEATVTFRCVAGADPNCSGTVEVDAQWRGVTSSVFIQTQ